MYKVITHTIREEHFTHPVTARVAIGDRMPADPTQMAANSPFATPAAIQYVDNVRSGMSRYNSALRAFLVSAIMNSEDMGILKQDLEKWSNEVIDTALGGYYPIQTSVPIRNDFQDFTKLLEDAVVAVRNKQSVAEIDTRLSAKINDLATKLSFVNRFNWPKQAFVDILHEFKANVYSQAQARVDKNWTGDLAAFDQSNRTLLTGQENGTVSLVDLLAKGIIVQFQSKFR